jgi:hypothetical protein
MAYKNAREVLPEALLLQIQHYCSGELLYIPAPTETKTVWGGRSGAKDHYAKRNEQIRRLYSEHYSAEKLAGMFYLSVDSIKKIVRSCAV